MLQYRVNTETGEWHHVDQPVFRDRKWLGRVYFGANGLEYSVPDIQSKPPTMQQCLRLAADIFENAQKVMLLYTIVNKYFRQLKMFPMVSLHK